ncbi:MAG: acylphosphatase [Bacteroidetes bacterium]|nr:acylphosphatase [Bacteroidota bacterium]
MLQTISIHVEGKVQGVNYRRYTREKALSLGLTGFVKNQRDGSVLISATGTQTNLDELINWCKEGPPAARVTGIIVKDEAFIEYTTFTIDR